MKIVETRVFIDDHSGIAMCPAYTGQSSAGGNTVCVAMDTGICWGLLVICEWSVTPMLDRQETRLRSANAAKIR